MKKVLSIILSIIMLIPMATVAFADETSERVANGTITVGINAEHASFEYYEDGELTGFDIDLMNYIGERINYDIDYVEMPFDKLIPAVVNGEVDCAISAITATDERESVVDFTRPYLVSKIQGTLGPNIEPTTEKYAIVFKSGVSDAIYKSSMPTDYEKLFMLVNGTIEELISDATIEKLIEKYELNDIFYRAGLNYSYSTALTDVTDKDVIDTVTVPAPSKWAAKDINFAYAIGITDNNKWYMYQNNITREEFCELIYNLVTLVKWEISAPVKDSFTDTKNDKILMLNGVGIVNGKSSIEFAPNDYLTREEAATILFRLINEIHLGGGTNAQYIIFDDSKDISEWAMDSVQAIYKIGIMNGVGNNRFAPKDTYTTEQAIATLVRVYRGAEAAGTIDHQNNELTHMGG